MLSYETSAAGQLPEYNQETQYLVFENGEYHVRQLPDEDGDAVQTEAPADFEEQLPWFDPNGEKEKTAIERLAQENEMLKHQLNASSERADFQEEVMTEIIYMLYNQ